MGFMDFHSFSWKCVKCINSIKTKRLLAFGGPSGTQNPQYSVGYSYIGASGRKRAKRFLCFSTFHTITILQFRPEINFTTFICHLSCKSTTFLTTFPIFPPPIFIFPPFIVVFFTTYSQFHNYFATSRHILQLLSVSGVSLRNL